MKHCASVSGGWMIAARVLTVFFLLGACGCGVKAPPLPPRAEPMTAVTDLAAARIPEGIELTWHAPQDQSDIAGYSIYSSQTETICRQCPVEFIKIGTRQADDAGGEGRLYRFAFPAAPGFHYRLKVVPFLTTGARGPDSNVQEIEYPNRNDQP